MNETTGNNGQDSGEQPHVPRLKFWIIGGLFFIAAVGMYAGTMYRIQNHGYVGVGADQPITPGTELKDTPN